MSDLDIAVRTWLIKPKHIQQLIPAVVVWYDSAIGSDV